MENMEVAFEIKTEYIDSLIYDEFQLNDEKIINSSFFGNIKNHDIGFSDIKSFRELFSESNGVVMYVKKLRTEIVMEGFQIALFFGPQSGFVEINFSKNELIHGDKIDKEKTYILLQYFKSIMDRYEIKKIYFGYEPAIDDNTCLIKIIKSTDDVRIMIENLSQDDIHCS
jgi:hypothetical protein